MRLKGCFGVLVVCAVLSSIAQHPRADDDAQGEYQGGGEDVGEDASNAGEASGESDQTTLCQPKTCENRGRCSIVNGSVSCECVPGNFGERCENDDVSLQDKKAFVSTFELGVAQCIYPHTQLFALSRSFQYFLFFFGQCEKAKRWES